jgi:DNA helicase-2/ATP-dependent DNA helicase PcrA
VLQRTGIRTAFAYLRIGSDPQNIRREDILETIRRPSRGIAPKVVDMLTSRPTTSITDIRRLAGRLSGRDVPKLGIYASDLDAVVRGCRTSSAAALKAIRVDVGLGETMDVLDSSRSEADRSTHTDDLAALESVAALHPDVATFETWLHGVLSRTAVEGPLVLLSTIHRIKGREWDHVVIYDASRGLFPHRLGNDEEGERRVFHVALTRARTQVVALADSDAPSIFLAELDGSRTRPTPRSADGTRHGAAIATGRRASGGARPDGTGRSGKRRSGTMVRPGAGAGPGTTAGQTAATTGESVEAAEAEKALRAWRSAMASQDAVPAYVILKDAELAGIAARHPSTLAELAACRGMGQIRLERWGDEILAVLETTRAG